jgi:hypothetical protein
MIDELGSILDAFPGAANQTRCFLHIINLVAKSILHQFEPPKSRDKDLLSEGAKELAALAKDLEESVDDHKGEDDDSDELEDDNVDGEKDEHEGMTDDEIAQLGEYVQPVRLVLAKASLFKLSFNLFTHTRPRRSYARLHSRLRTPPPSSSPHGIQHWRNSALMLE